MTWAEFKKEVERQGVTDDMDVASIEVFYTHRSTLPYNANVNVELDHWTRTLKPCFTVRS